MARKELRRAILVALWSILDPLGHRFRRVFDALSLDRAVRSSEKRRRGDLRKNLQKHCVLRVRTHVRAFAAFACTTRKFLKINRKSFRTGFSSESRDGSLSERSFFELASVKMVPEGSPERLERRLGTLLGALGPLLGRSWALLGRSWALLGRSWALLGRSWAVP